MQKRYFFRPCLRLKVGLEFLLFQTGFFAQGRTS